MRELSGVTFIRALIAEVLMTSQSSLPPSTITLGIRFQHRNFEGNERLIYGSYYITGSGVPRWPDYSGHLLRPNRMATVSMGMGNREWILGDIYPLPCDAIILLSEVRDLAPIFLRQNVHVLMF